MDLEITQIVNSIIDNNNAEIHKNKQIIKTIIKGYSGVTVEGIEIN